ncbi:hypothetical protein BDV28DRAFT_137258 [Aspergillus coremiiformis]|uniref:Uncharacterized protein n=1 Tax=Aspergillus coremiiformis TaxID=138285 RepID=A0A5N6Z2P4_9EURO|nr:hypothetical protein BDV28DRAFT_137258 [Aspergillus coremiiformis]
MLICTPDSKHQAAARQPNAVRKLNHTRKKPSRPLATMATVSITSDLESYLASLRSYLARNRPASPGLEDRVDGQSRRSSNHHATQHSQPQVELSQGMKNSDSLGGTRAMMENRS